MLNTNLAELRRAEGVRLLRITEVMARTGLGRSSIYALAAEGRFPRPIRVDGVRAAVWPSDALDLWVAAQLNKAEG